MAKTEEAMEDLVAAPTVRQSENRIRAHRDHPDLQVNPATKDRTE
jgi:hypothetical protein